jgi:hypothetical protein
MLAARLIAQHHALRPCDPWVDSSVLWMMDMSYLMKSIKYLLGELPCFFKMAARLIAQRHAFNPWGDFLVIQLQFLTLTVKDCLCALPFYTSSSSV